MGRFQDLAGQKFNRLQVLRRGPNHKLQTRWWCVCDCGKQALVKAGHLKNSNTKSCGCWNLDVIITRNTSHGACGTRTYVAWKAMRNRCMNSESSDFYLYGGRGIKITRRWDEFEAFFTDMKTCPEGHSLDRRNTNGNYSKRNCRWATPAEQSRNKRNNRWIQHKGERMILTDWATKLGCTPSHLWRRLARMSPAKALEPR